MSQFQLTIIVGHVVGSAPGPGPQSCPGADPLPDQVDRNARQHDQEADSRGLGLEVDEIEHEERSPGPM